MRKALVNYWVDMLTGVAFVLCAVTGIVFLFPGTVHVVSGAAPTIWLVPATWWHNVHDWSGVAMVAGTALHLALHARWITVMTRRTFGAPAATESADSGRPRRAPHPAPAAGLLPAPGAGVPAFQTTAEADAAAAASLRRLETLRSERLREREQRISRRRFLTGAAALGGVALLAGVGLFGRDAVSAAGARLSDNGWTDDGQSASSGATSDAGSSGASGAATDGTDGSASGAGSVGSSASSGSAGASSTTQVVVSESACVACGRCLQVCPGSVFGWSSAGRAEAVNAGACSRCGRCLQVCPAAAITVSA
jgi:Pyruvate/2-oxoacid:ferredoxin oxidoreductase delta subunit